MHTILILWRKYYNCVSLNYMLVNVGLSKLILTNLTAPIQWFGESLDDSNSYCFQSVCYIDSLKTKTAN